jgi:hypothetical protein
MLHLRTIAGAESSSKPISSNVFFSPVYSWRARPCIGGRLPLQGEGDLLDGEGPSLGGDGLSLRGDGEPLQGGDNKLVHDRDQSARTAQGT